MAHLTLYDPENSSILASYDLTKAEVLAMHMLGSNIRELFPATTEPVTWDPDAAGLALEAITNNQVPTLALPTSLLAALDQSLPTNMEEKPQSEITEEDLATINWQQGFTRDDQAWVRYSKELPILQALTEEQQNELNTGTALTMAAQLQDELILLADFIKLAQAHPGSSLSVTTSPVVSAPAPVTPDPVDPAPVAPVTEPIPTPEPEPVTEPVAPTPVEIPVEETPVSVDQAPSA